MGNANDRGAAAPATLNDYFNGVAQRFGVDNDGIPKMPGFTPEQTKEWMTRMTSVDDALNDAAARGAQAVSERSRAGKLETRLTKDMQDLRDVPNKLEELDNKKNIMASEKPGMAASILRNTSEGVDNTVKEFARRLDGPTDQERIAGNFQAIEAFEAGTLHSNPNVSVGMSAFMAPNDVQRFSDLSGRLANVNSVNRFLNYDQTPQDHSKERGLFREAMRPTLNNMPTHLDEVYRDSKMGVNKDGHAEVKEANRQMDVIAKNLDRIQQRDGIGNDGSFKLPMMTEAQSKDWLERCERTNDALIKLDKLYEQGAKMSPALEDAGRRAEIGIDRMMDMPGVLKRADVPNLSDRDKQTTLDKINRDMAALDKVVDELDSAMIDHQIAQQNKRGFGSSFLGAAARASGAMRNMFSRSKSEPEVAPASPRQTPAGPQTQTAPVTQTASMTQAPPQQTAWQRASATPEAPPKAESMAEIAARTQAQNHISVQSGEIGHEMNKGAGFAAMGTVDAVKHAGNTVELDYTVAGHHQAIKIDESKDPASRALGDAAEHLKPGESFKLTIGRDRTSHEVAQLDDRSTGHTVQVRDTGQVEQRDQAPNLQRSRDNQGR